MFFKNSQRLNTVNYFNKKLHFRCFPWLWIRLWLSRGFSIIINQGFHFESSTNFARTSTLEFDWVLNTSWVLNCFYVDLVNRISSERKVKRNLGTSNRWPHIVPNRRFEGPLGDVLRTSWGRPESTFQGRPLEARLRCPQDVILERPKDTESGRLRDGHIGSSGGVLGTNICRLSM